MNCNDFNVDSDGHKWTFVRTIGSLKGFRRESRKDADNEVKIKKTLN